MRRLCLLACVVLASYWANAQDDFREGYIISLNGDTLRGWVINPPVKSRVTACEFRSDITGPSALYEPVSIAAFGIYGDDRLFESFILPGVKDGRKVFAEVLFRGRADLLWFDEFFYVRKDTLTERIDKASTRQSSHADTRYVHTHKTYIGTLNRYMSDCLPSRLYRGEVAYSEKDFVNIFEEYSRCSGTASREFKRTVKKEKITFQVLAGLSSARFGFQETDLDVFKTSTDVFFGGGITIPMALVGDKFFLTVDAIYQGQAFSGKREGFTPSGRVMKDYVVSLSMLKFPVARRCIWEKE